MISGVPPTSNKWQRSDCSSCSAKTEKRKQVLQAKNHKNQFNDLYLPKKRWKKSRVLKSRNNKVCLKTKAVPAFRMTDHFEFLVLIIQSVIPLNDLTGPLTLIRSIYFSAFRENAITSHADTPQCCHIVPSHSCN